MSTKNISRTINEGGRASYAKDRRKEYHSLTRAKTRDWLSKVRQDLSITEDSDHYTNVKNVATKRSLRDFADKTAVVNRWLFRNVNQPWNDVKSKIISMFDTNTVTGHHNAYDHFINNVEYNTTKIALEGFDFFAVNYYAPIFYVDDGILLVRPRQKKPRYYKLNKFDYTEICNFLKGRVIAKIGDHLFWFNIVTKYKYSTTNEPEVRTVFYKQYNEFFIESLLHNVEYVKLNGILCINPDGSAKTKPYSSWNRVSTNHLKQNKMLTSDEEEYIWSLPFDIQKLIFKQFDNFL